MFRRLLFVLFLLVLAAAAARAGEWRKYGREAPDLIVTHKDPQRRVNLRNLRGSVVVLLSWNFKGVPEAGVKRDPHC